MSKLLKSLYQKDKRQWVEVLVWSLVTIFVVVARAIYYSKSHSLTSIWMDNAWIAPAIYLGIQLVLAFLGKDEGPYGRLCANTGVASLIVYLFLMGVYEMASNYNESTPMFLYIGVAFLAVGLVLTILYFVKKPTSVSETKQV
jgi:uncharacterized protein involved in response to NO